MSAKYNTISLEDLDSILSHPLINAYLGDEESGVKRRKSFEIGDKIKFHYTIEWWCNVCYLYTPGNVTIVFNDLEISGSWPNNAKTNMQFLYNRPNGQREVIAILPIEHHEELHNA